MESAAVTLQEVIDGETRRGALRPDEVHLDGVDTRRGLLHHEWAFVRRVGESREQLAVIMIVEFSPAIIHVIGDVKLVCKVQELYKQDLELSRYLEDESYSSP
jgi:hypothetical protein